MEELVRARRSPPCLIEEGEERVALPALLFAVRAFGQPWLELSGYVICSGPVARPIFFVRQRLTRTFIIQLFTWDSQNGEITGDVARDDSMRKRQVQRKSSRGGGAPSCRFGEIDPLGLSAPYPVLKRPVLSLLRL